MSKPPPVIPFQHPELPPPSAILEYYALSERASYYANGGPCHQLLAERLGAYLGSETLCMPVSNCTAGLMVALRALCGEPTPERRHIVCPSYTFTATACAIVWSGFDPLFVDVEEGGWHLDPVSLEAALERHGDRVAGILACSTLGTAPAASQRMRWRELSAAFAVPLMIDSAPGFGAIDEDGRRLGSLGDVEVFSFHATKPFAIGEGGVIVTTDPDLKARLEMLTNFGIDKPSRASVEVGFNAKMSELHAAAALAMLDRIEDVLNRRRESAAQLRASIAHLPYTFQSGAEQSTWQVFQLRARSAQLRERCLELAAHRGIEVRGLHDPPLHRQPAFARYTMSELPVTEALAETGLALPMSNRLPGDAFERLPALLAAAAG
jgi:dTDP-4-amino-4,6-dideoxygalactose transaminase